MASELEISTSWWDELEKTKDEKERDWEFIMSTSWHEELKKTEEEEESESETLWRKQEEKLFRKISNYLSVDSSGLGLFTMKKLSELPVSTSAEKLEELAVIICEDIFNTPLKKADVSKYVQFYQDFAYLKVTKTQCKSKQKVSFEEILTITFLNKLVDRFSYSKRLSDLVKNRQISDEKKAKWIIRCTKQQRPYLKQTDTKSINFLSGLFEWNPEIVYKAVEVLLKCNSIEATEYIRALLQAIKQQNNSNENTSDWRSEMLDISGSVWRYSQREKNEHDLLLQKVNKLAEENVWVKTFTNVKMLIKEFLSKKQRKGLKYFYPEDYIKMCIANDIASDEWGRMKDDFENDSDEEAIVSETNSSNHLSYEKPL